MKYRKWLFWLFVFLLLGIALLRSSSRRRALSGLGKPKIALVPLEGIILTGEAGDRGIFGQGTIGSDHVLSLFKSLADRKDIKAVLLRINSPGGTVAGSQEIYSGIQFLRSKGKKVVVSMADVCASGGYYIASAADAVFANPGTLTGSIGAIFVVQKLEELYKKLGIGIEVVKSGKYKDIGSPYRSMSPEEKKILKNVIEDVYTQFVADVAKGRRLPYNAMKKLADGRIYTGRQALKLKLVDRLGNVSEALDYAAKIAGIEGEPFIERFEEEKSLLGALFGKTMAKLPSFHYPLIMYLYTP